MTTLLLAEGNGDATLRALTAARMLGGEVHLAEIPPHALAEPLAEAVRAIADRYDAIVAPATSTGRNFVPRLAALLDVMVVSEVTRILAPDTFERPIYAGSAIETVRCNEPRRLLTVRTAAFPPTSASGLSTVVLSVAQPTLARLVSQEMGSSDLPELGTARTVVAGGQALGSKENFEALLLPLAEKLGAAVAATRAAVDAGFAANDLQVGQTGRSVAPDLYIAVGISGAVQHLAGMKTSKIIVAINSDPDAPIFSVADYGLVGDLFTIVPELTAAL